MPRRTFGCARSHSGGRLIKHTRYYWRLLAESHLTRRLIWRHAAEDRNAAFASRTSGAQSAADFRDEIERNGRSV